MNSELKSADLEEEALSREILGLREQGCIRPSSDPQPDVEAWQKVDTCRTTSTLISEVAILDQRGKTLFFPKKSGVVFFFPLLKSKIPADQEAFQHRLQP